MGRDRLDGSYFLLFHFHRRKRLRGCFQISDRVISVAVEAQFHFLQPHALFGPQKCTFGSLLCPRGAALEGSFFLENQNPPYTFDRSGGRYMQRNASNIFCGTGPNNMGRAHQRKLDCARTWRLPPLIKITVGAGLI